jgi:hypothetical protein
VVAIGVAVVMVVLAGAAARMRSVVPARAVPVGALVVVRGGERVEAPVALLYVDRGCGHCAAAVGRFDSLVRSEGVSGFIVSHEHVDSGAALERYADGLGVTASGLAIDTAYTVAKAARLRAVPVLVMVSRAGLATVSYGVPGRLPRP